MTSGRVITLSSDDLPLSCPPQNGANWDLHPRVYLTLNAENAEVVCPYCGTHYRLVDADKDAM